MSISKVILNGVTQIDLTADTVTANALEINKTAHDASGGAIVGSNAGTDWNAIAMRSIPTGALNLSTATIIENGAFRDCGDITSVSAPLVSQVKDYAFCWCTANTSVSLPLAEEVASYAFCGNSISSITLPNATEIGANAFQDTPPITMTLPKITSVGAYMARGIKSGSSTFDFGPSLSTIAKNAFWGTDYASPCTLILRNPSSVVSLGNADSVPYAFWHANKVATLYVPQNLLSLYSTATTWATSYATASTTFTAIEGSYYETHYADGTTIST